MIFDLAFYFLFMICVRICKWQSDIILNECINLSIFWINIVIFFVIWVVLGILRGYGSNKEFTFLKRPALKPSETSMCLNVLHDMDWSTHTSQVQQEDTVFTMLLLLQSLQQYILLLFEELFKATMSKI